MYSFLSLALALMIHNKQTEIRNWLKKSLNKLLIQGFTNIPILIFFRVDSSTLVFSLSSHRHSFIGFVCNSRFNDS